jgi:hypothetical protein
LGDCVASTDESITLGEQMVAAAHGALEFSHQLLGLVVGEPFAADPVEVNLGLASFANGLATLTESATSEDSLF